MLTWALCIAILCGACACVWYRYGPSQAIATAVFVSILIPQWVRLDITSAIWLNVPITVTAFTLLLFLAHPRSSYVLYLRPPDYAILALLLVHVISDSLNERFEFGVFLRAYGEWFLPYVAGRVAIQSLADVRWTVPVAASVGLALAICGVIESISGTNPFELLFGSRPLDGVALDAARFGLKRAYGPLMHSLYLGTLQMLLLPWALYFCQDCLLPAQDRGSGWLAGLPVSLLGIASSLSRGPILAAGVLVYVLQLLIRPTWRCVLAAVGIVTVAGSIAFSTAILDGLDVMTTEHSNRMQTPVGDKNVHYTSTRHRVLLFQVYAYPLKQAGLFGYGTTRCSQFPPDVPMDQPHGRVRAIDNQYLLMTLRLGYVGMAVFTLLNIVTALEFGRLTLLSRGHGRVWLGAMCGMVVAMVLMFMLVWQPQDFGFLYLFSLGSAAGIGAHYQSRRKQALPGALPLKDSSSDLAAWTQ